MDGKQLVGIGLIIIILISGFFMWQSSAVISAQADVEKVVYAISVLRTEKSDSTSEEKQGDIQKLIEEKEKEIVDLKREFREEKVDAISGRWCLTMMKWGGLLILGLGLMMVVKSGSDYEKLGALIAIGYIVMNMSQFGA